MSYLPYYIRPVASPSSASGLTTTTTSHSTSRSVYSSTVTSPATSVTSSARTSPTRSMKDESFGTLPRASGCRRYERSNTSYVGYREDYIKKQNDKNCGKKTLEDRLKSLESEASVKLQVRKGSRGRHRKTSDRDFLVGLRSPNRSLPSPSSSVRSSSLKLSENQAESTPPAVTPSPPPDIIQSHQLPDQTEVNSENFQTQFAENSAVSDKEIPQRSPSPTEKKVPKPKIEPLKTNYESPKLDLKPVTFQRTSSSASKTKETMPTASTSHNNKLSLDSVRIKERVLPKNVVYPAIAKETTIVDDLDTYVNQPVSKSTSKKEPRTYPPSPMATRTISVESSLLNSNRTNVSTTSHSASQKETPMVKQKPKQPYPSPVIKHQPRPQKLQHQQKQPQQEQQQQLKHQQQHQQQQKEHQQLKQHQQQQPSTKEAFTIPKEATDHRSPPHIVETTKVLTEQKGTETEHQTTPDIVTPIPRRDKPVVMDVTTDNAVVPVELRSPRSSGPRDGGSGRMNMRAKRNARVFVFPSSDESETENIMAKLNRYNSNRPPPIAPVTFVPTQSSTNQVGPAQGFESGSQTTSSSSSLPLNAKGNLPQDKAITSSQANEQRRKSSRSPKRSPQKRSNRSKSNHDRSNTEKIKHTRTLSSGSRSPATLSTSSVDPHTGRSPETPIRSGRCGSKSTRNSSKTRYKTEYTELTSSSRSTPRSPRELEFANIPSPRQQAVADAVKFGVSETDGRIPYIDGANTPEDQKTLLTESSHQPLPLCEADQATIKRAFPISRRGRSSRRKEEPRRTSYKEAVDGNTDETAVNVDDSRWFRYGMVFTDSDKEEILASLGKLVRSNSADSVLSTSDTPNTVVLRNTARASSADRNSLKGVYRRSYQIATNQAVDGDLLNTLTEKPQTNTKRLRNFFSESTPSHGEPPGDESRWGLRSRSFGPPPPTLIINRLEESIIKEGFLYFKVATIEKGKRTSAQKSWKFVWVVLKDQLLYLCKDWSRNKQENGSFSTFGAGSPPGQLVLEDEEALDIESSLISIAYNYQKRKNVFRLTTFNGSEYLFQAEDREEMLGWINVIQISGNHANEEGEVVINEELILRKTNQFDIGPKQDKRSTKRSRSPKPTRRVNVPVKDDGSRRFKWRGSVNRIVKKFGQGQSLLQGATFDVLLEDCPPSENNELIPFIVDLCCRIVEQHGLSFTGIYRVPGNTGTLQALQDELNLKGAEAIDLENDERFCDLNVVSSLLKSFFRKLPDPLFTNELYDDFITMNRKSNPEERLSGIRRLIHMLPAPHYETLKYLITHLRKISDNSAVNKMEIRNLAIVFGPTLVKNTATDNMATMVTDMSDQCRIVESVLQHASWYFCEDDEKAKMLFPDLPPPRVSHEEPNLDHLLANVGRTTDDISDTASNSSRSKTSFVAEKESFSRDVMDSIFGKQWTDPPTLGEKDVGTKRESTDEDYDPSRDGEVAPRISSADFSLPLSTSLSQHHPPGRPAIAGSKNARPLSKEHLPLDYNSRLRDFFYENMECLARLDINRSLPHLSSSSAESSPQVTPRTSMLGLPQPSVQRTYPAWQHSRRLSDGKPMSQSVSSRVEYNIQVSTPISSPHFQRHIRSQKDPMSKATPSGFWPTGTIFRDVRDNQARSVLSSRSRSELSSRESLMADVESDSDTSIFTGETLEEKLRNLTNLNKRLESRSARRQGNRDCTNLKPPPNTSTPIKPLKKNAVSPNTDSCENLQSFSKKSSQELYQERKAQRQQHRNVKGQRTNRKDFVDLSRCISDENIYAISDPLRQSARTDIDILRKRLSAKSKRRHTLGSGDFPDPSFWDNSQSVSLQNITRDIHDMALLRLRPQLRASAPSLFPQTPNARLIWYGIPNPRSDWARKPETHI